MKFLIQSLLIHKIVVIMNQIKWMKKLIKGKNIINIAIIMNKNAQTNKNCIYLLKFQKTTPVHRLEKIIKTNIKRAMTKRKKMQNKLKNRKTKNQINLNITIQKDNNLKIVKKMSVKKNRTMKKMIKIKTIKKVNTVLL